MTSDQDGARPQEHGRDEKATGEVPEQPADRPAEALAALEDRQPDGADPDDGERRAGDDVTDNPGDEEMDGLPGPSPDEPAEPAG